MKVRNIQKSYHYLNQTQFQTARQVFYKFHSHIRDKITYSPDKNNHYLHNFTQTKFFNKNNDEVGKIQVPVFQNKFLQQISIHDAFKNKNKNCQSIYKSKICQHKLSKTFRKSNGQREVIFNKLNNISQRSISLDNQINQSMNKSLSYKFKANSKSCFNENYKKPIIKIELNNLRFLSLQNGVQKNVLQSKKQNYKRFFRRQSKNTKIFYNELHHVQKNFYSITNKQVKAKTSKLKRTNTYRNSEDLISNENNQKLFKFF